jgi:ATP-dependent Clp protease ATP-binding subunit ClpX
VLEVAKKAISLKTGARGLRTIFENLMLDSMYYVPSESDIEKVIIDKDVVLGNKSPEIIRKNIA